ncbi:MAG TPA: hypothetical protein VL860_02595 [Planctomycetota bacterium]|nr:hypothetical protein [Planctomycetota bacterium]
MPFVFLAGFALVIALIIGAIIYGYIANKKRMEALGALAAQNGLRFQEGRGAATLNYDVFEQGDNRYAENTLTGTWKDRPVQMGDFHYETQSTDSKGNRTTTHHHFSYCHLLIANARFQGLFIRPEGFFDKLTALVGFDDIDFESAEFSKKFYVKSPDRKFAYDIVSPRMMEFLLARPWFTIYISDFGILVLAGSGTWSAEEFASRADFATEFLGLIPDYVWEQWRA